MSDVFTLRGPIKKDRPEPTKRTLTRKPRRHFARHG
jgi:hypothetical protein